MEIVNLQFSDGMVMKRPSIYGMLFFFFLADPFAGKYTVIAINRAFAYKEYSSLHWSFKLTQL